MKSGYKKSAMRFALLGLLLAVLPASAQDVLIGTESELREFASDVNSGTNYSGQTICLTTNITLQEGAWTPIGTSDHPFNGHFEGWGHVISGLSINAGSNDYQGLFGYVAGGSIHDVAVTGSGSVMGQNYVGGICGYLASGEIVSCYSEISVTGVTAVGGICGMLAGGKIKDCYVRGAVSGTPSNYYGAIVGRETAGTLKNCLYDNKVITKTYAIGNHEDYGIPRDDTPNCVMPFATITNGNIDTWAQLNDEKNNEVWKLTVGSYPQLRSFLKNEPLNFRMWNVTDGVIYRLMPDRAISYEADAIYGSYNSPVVMTATEERTQHIDLCESWSWVSLNVKSPLAGNVRKLLATGTWSNGDQLKDPENQTFYNYSNSQ